MTTFRRAVKETQKLERRQAILDAARNVFASSTYQDVTLETVAREAGVSRGTLYLYFKTREELFLIVFQELFFQWLDEIDGPLVHIPDTVGVDERIEQVTQLISSSLAQHDTLVRLLSILHGVLEHNIDFPTALEFKNTIYVRSNETGKLLEHCLPFLPAGQGLFLLMYINTLVTGLMQQAELPPVMRRVFAEPGMDALRIEFQPSFTRIFRALLYGLRQEQQGG